MAARDPDSVRGEIRRAAAETLIRGGFHGTRLLDIARAANMSKGGVFHHYATKDALLRDVVQSCFAFIEGVLEGVASARPPQDIAERPFAIIVEALDGIATMVACHLELLDASPDSPSEYGCLLVQIREQALRDTACAEILERHVARLVAIYAAELPAAVTEGAVGVTGDTPDGIARAIVCFVLGIGLLGTPERPPPAGGAALPIGPEGAAELVSFILAALARRRLQEEGTQVAA